MTTSTNALFERIQVSYELSGFDVEILKSNNVKNFTYKLRTTTFNKIELVNIHKKTFQDVKSKFNKFFGDWAELGGEFNVLFKGWAVLSRVLKALGGIARQILSQKYQELSISSVTTLSNYISFELFGLQQLLPLFIDKEVKRIYLNVSDGVVSLEHSRFKKCSSNIILSSLEIENIKRWVQFTRIDFFGPTALFIIVKPNALGLHLRADIKRSKLNLKETLISLRKLNYIDLKEMKEKIRVD